MKIQITDVGSWKGAGCPTFITPKGKLLVGLYDGWTTHDDFAFDFCRRRGIKPQGGISCLAELLRRGYVRVASTDAFLVWDESALTKPVMTTMLLILNQARNPAGYVDVLKTNETKIVSATSGKLREPGMAFLNPDVNPTPMSSSGMVGKTVTSDNVFVSALIQDVEVFHDAVFQVVDFGDITGSVDPGMPFCGSRPPPHITSGEWLVLLKTVIGSSDGTSPRTGQYVWLSRPSLRSFRFVDPALEPSAPQEQESMQDKEREFFFPKRLSEVVFDQCPKCGTRTQWFGSADWCPSCQVPAWSTEEAATKYPKHRRNPTCSIPSGTRVRGTIIKTWTGTVVQPGSGVVVVQWDPGLIPTAPKDPAEEEVSNLEVLEELMSKSTSPVPDVLPLPADPEAEFLFPKRLSMENYPKCLKCGTDTVYRGGMDWCPNCQVFVWGMEEAAKLHPKHRRNPLGNPPWGHVQSTPEPRFVGWETAFLSGRYGPIEVTVVVPLVYDHLAEEWLVTVTDDRGRSRTVWERDLVGR